MKILLSFICFAIGDGNLIAGASGLSQRGRLRGLWGSSQFIVRTDTDIDRSVHTVASTTEAEWPPSCNIFVEMLGRVYFLREQLDRTIGSVSFMGYATGREWVMDQGIGNVTPATLPSVVCSLLSSTSKPAVSLLAEPAQPGEADEAEPAAKEERTFSESLGLPPVRIPGWLGGSSEEESTGTPQPVTTEKQQQDPKSQPSVIKDNETTQTRELPVSESVGAAAPGPAPAEGGGCPVGSMQDRVLSKLEAGFNSVKEQDELLPSIRHALEPLLSIENGVMALYNFRGCPPVPKHEFKTQHVCKVHRDKLANGLRLLQGDMPRVRSKLFALRARLQEIDRGTSSECVSTDSQKRQPSLGPEQLRWCLELQAVTDALLDGRRGQSSWLKDMGDGMQHLGAMSMQLNQHIQDKALKKDKIPLNALKALTRSWKSLQAPIEQLRAIGSIRAEQAVKVDVSVLQLVAFLRNASIEDNCASEGFRMRYSSRTCASLRLQLSAAAAARQTDVSSLEESAQKMMQTASDGLISNKCTSPPMTHGCWVRMPSGCPKLHAWKSADKWTRDVFGEQSTGAAESKVVCTVSRKTQMDVLCGVSDTEMRFIPVSTEASE